MSYAERAVVQISRPVKDALDDMQAEQQRRLKRQVSYSEIIERMLEREGYDFRAESGGAA